MKPRTFRNRHGDLVELPEVPATQAKNAFGEVLERAAATGAVAITRHDVPKAVLLSFAEFESLSAARAASLAELGAEFEGLLDGLQTPAARRAMRTAFDADTTVLGRAAVKAARRRR